MRVNNKVGKTQDLEYSGCPIDGRSYLGQRQKADKDQPSCGSGDASFRFPGGL